MKRCRAVIHPLQALANVRRGRILLCRDLAAAEPELPLQKPSEHLASVSSTVPQSQKQQDGDRELGRVAYLLVLGDHRQGALLLDAVEGVSGRPEPGDRELLRALLPRRPEGHERRRSAGLRRKLPLRRCRVICSSSTEISQNFAEQTRSNLTRGTNSVTFT